MAKGKAPTQEPKFQDPPKVVNFPKDERPNLSSLVPTPENVKAEDPVIRKRLMERQVTELVNQSSQLQQTIMEAQFKIASNNILIDSIVSQADKEKIELEFQIGPPPEAVEERPAPSE
jgi:putative heme iron utilization protein